MIATSNPGMADVDLGAYLVSAQAICADNPHIRIELIPGTESNTIHSESVCLEEGENWSLEEWTVCACEHLELLEECLSSLKS